MKIACLQFAPQVGDVDNNLDRADAVLNSIKEEVLDSLDLLVLPELALTGYNFKSLQHISPCLEQEGTGITSLWARTTALKHECAVIAGYPEKVDVSNNWPTSPEYYNSSLMIDCDGETVGNYRKSHLYFTDETWALEGRDGFFDADVPGLGTVVMGICTDINPYKLDAPWDAFEFGYHIMEVQANVVVLAMAWQTHEDLARYSLQSKEPDLEALVYWVQRLEPLVCADKEDEVIVVFCNRVGNEGQVTYAGTSAVLGVKAGNVFVYGVLGRGESGLLVVDTDQPPISRLTEQPSAEAEEVNPMKETSAPKVIELPVPVKTESPRDRLTLEMPNPEIKVTHPTPLSPRLPWLASPTDPTAQSPTNPRSPTRLQIPTSPTRLQIPTEPSRTVVGEFTLIDSALADNVVIESPGSSRSLSPADPLRRFKPSMPSTPWRFRDKQSPSPWHFNSGPHSAVFGGGACMTPITPFEVEDLWNRDATPIDTKPPNWYWKHEQKLTALNEESIQEQEEGEEEEKSPKAIIPLTNRDAESPLKSALHNPLPSFSSPPDLDDATPIEEDPPEWLWKHEPTLAVLGEEAEEEEEEEAPPAKELESGYTSTPIDQQPPDWYWKHEPSLSALNEDEEEEEEATYTTSASHVQEWQSLSSVLANLKIHPNSSLNNVRSSSNSDRPSSPKSRNASRQRSELNHRRSQSPLNHFKSSTQQQQQHYRPPSRLRHAVSASEDFDVIQIEEEKEEREEEPSRGRRGTSRVDDLLNRGRQPLREGSIERSGSVGRSRLRYQPVQYEDRQEQDKRWGSVMHWQEDEEDEEVEVIPAVTKGVPSSSISVSTLGDNSTMPSPDSPEWLHSSTTTSMLSLSIKEEDNGVKVRELPDSAASMLNEEWGRRREEAIRQGQV
ncbi:carbon-nitrogen hydrolase [Podospora fimiseda]|uniref:Carbon-nitrogen hydrolase n=1 Tax=Podospora fimiseda TaxID=252190 RepID=A0AAN7BRR4_9PEZI|nr:carbon-nitrogen hydrolase [Podospora fimiseda]